MAHAAVLARNPALARTFAQVAGYPAAWARANAETFAALDRVGAAGRARLWVVLGDSCALGVGATAFDRGYVGIVHRSLAAGGEPWLVVNLAACGARTRDVVVSQLPQLNRLPAPDLVTAVVGGNDLIGTPLRAWGQAVDALAATLAPGAVLGTVPQGFRERKARAGNDRVRAAAAAHGHRVADVWACTGPPWRGKYADGMHPSEVGHRDWARAVLEAVAPVASAAPALVGGRL